MGLTLGYADALDIWRGAVLDGLRADPRDLSQRQMAVILSVYMSDEPQTVRGLAAALGVGKPAISRALDRLEKLELVRRIRDSRDKRSIVVGRTVAGAVYLRDMGERIARAAAAQPAPPSR